MQVGGVVILESEPDRYIYNLVTKEKYSDKPTYDNIRKSLVAMRTHCISKNVEIVSMLKLVSGLDNMTWKKIHEMIMNVFRSSDIEIRIYSLTQHQDS